jgi:hypothetical protein
MRRIENERLKYHLKSDLIKQILSDIVFDLVIFLFGVCVGFGHKVHLASENDIGPHYLFDYSSLNCLVNALSLNLCHFLVFGGTGSGGQGVAFLVLACLQLAYDL